jgi:hypothetical protein
MKKTIFLTLITALSYSCNKDKSKFQYKVQTTADRCWVQFYNNVGERVDTTITSNIYLYEWKEEYKARKLTMFAYTLTSGGAIVTLYRDGAVIASDTCNGQYQIASVTFN